MEVGHSESPADLWQQLWVQCLAQRHLEPSTFLPGGTERSWVTSRSADAAVSPPHPSCGCGDGGDASPVSNRWAQPCITSAEPPTPGDATRTRTHTATPAGCLKKINTNSWQKIIPWTRTSWEHVYFYIMYNMLCVCSAASGLTSQGKQLRLISCCCFTKDWNWENNWVHLPKYSTYCCD